MIRLPRRAIETWTYGVEKSRFRERSIGPMVELAGLVPAMELPFLPP